MVFFSWTGLSCHRCNKEKDNDSCNREIPEKCAHNKLVSQFL